MTSLTLIHVAMGLALLLLASLIPLAAWHRLYFHVRGWWLMPVVYGVGVATTSVVIAHPTTSRPWMLLVPAVGVALMWISECHLILHSAPRLANGWFGRVMWPEYEDKSDEGESCDGVSPRP